MSNLLDKASIILTPTAYNNGEALCVKPSDGSGDFDFSRNSAATRVNAQGLVENVQSLSSNLITNGDFATDSDWQLTQATISNGEATFATTDGSFAGIRQNVFTIGKTYLISIEVSNLVGTAEVNTNGGTSIGLDITSVGTKSFYMVANSTDIEIKRKFGITNVSATIDNVSVREVIDNTNLPRINYEGFSFDGSGNVVPDSGCGSWLFEPQSTNILEYSENFISGNWIKDDVTILSDLSISPSGESNSSIVVVNTVASRHNLKRAKAGVNTATLSIFAKAKELSYIQIASANTTGQFANFDLSNGTIGSVGSSFSDAKIENYGNGWYRCSVVSDNQYNQAIFSLVTSPTSPWLETWTSSNNTDGLYIWGAMLDENPYATSYIPTDGSTVTRNQDLCTNGGSLASINSTSGTLYAEIAALADDGTSRRITLLESLNNKVSLILSSTSNSIQGLVVSGGSVQFNETFATLNTLDFNKIAVSYAENNFALWVNGVKVRTDTSGVTFSENTLTNISFADANNTSNKFFGKTKALAVFPYLSDAELTELTTI